MAEDRPAPSQQQGLQQAASLIFALVAVVPLLIFAWTLHSLGAIRSLRAQLALGLALGIALLGFWMFRALLGRMADVVRALAAALEQATRTRLAPAFAAPAAGAGSAPGAPAQPVARATGPAPAPASGGQDRAVPGLGSIRELTEVVRAVDALWHREATAHLGLRVSVSVANSREPLVGVLHEASADGLILEQSDGAIAVAYGRVTAIDRLP